MKPLPSFAYSRFLVAGAVAGVWALTPSSLIGADWQTLLNNPPFGQAAAAPAATPAAGELEFRGVVEESGVSYVNLFNPTTKKSEWVAVNGQGSGLEVKSYDSDEEKVQVTQAGRLLTLPLKQSKVTLAKAPVLPPPGEKKQKDDNGDNEENADRKAEIKNLIRTRLEAGGDPEQVMRSLPPEAQAMMEEFRRRRAERAAAADDEPVTKKSGAKAEKTEASPKVKRKLSN